MQFLRAFVLAIPITLLTVGGGRSQEKPEPKPEWVVIDLNKLPPEVVKRLLDELAKERIGNVTTERKARNKGGERPTSGKNSSAKPAEKERGREDR